MHPIRYFILCAPVTTIPLFWISAQVLAHALTRTRESGLGIDALEYSDILLLIATAFGALGCIGLVISAFPEMYRNPGVRKFATLAVISGLCAVGIVASALVIYPITGSLTESGISRLPKIIFVATALLGWPLISGIFALKSLLMVTKSKL